MPELNILSFKRVKQQRGGTVQAVNDSMPTLALETGEEPVQETEHVSVLHLVHAMEEQLHAIGTLITKVDELVQDVRKERTFVDSPVSIGSTVGYTVDYLGRKFLFMRSATAITLVASDGTTQPIASGVWTNISYPRGTTLTVQGGSNSSPTPVTVRACDIAIASGLTETLDQSHYPVNAIPVANSSGNVANAVATATLPGVAGKTLYLAGFVVSSNGATTSITVNVTITGLTGGTQTYAYTIPPLSAQAGQIPLQLPATFFPPIPASGQDVSVVISCPALGAGNTNASVNAWGYYL